MAVGAYLVAAAVSVCAGLDRTAVLQSMASRPLVVAPLTGWLLGDVLVGLEVAILLELLWLGRLPVGAAIPPDDTQVAIAATLLAVSQGGELGLSRVAMAVLCTLVALPLGKVGQIFERMARNRNAGLLHRAQSALEAGDLKGVEQAHLFGLAHFAAASLATFTVVAVCGALILQLLPQLAVQTVAESGNWLRLALPLVGMAAILGTANVQRSLTLFCASFASALLMLMLA